MGKVEIGFRWYDLWIGAFIDTESRTVYICPLPMVVIKYQYGVSKRRSLVKRLQRLELIATKWRIQYERAQDKVKESDALIDVYLERIERQEKQVDQLLAEALERIES